MHICLARKSTRKGGFVLALQKQAASSTHLLNVHQANTKKSQKGFLSEYWTSIFKKILQPFTWVIRPANGTKSFIFETFITLLTSVDLIL